MKSVFGTRNIAGQYKEWQKLNVIERLEPLLGAAGYYVKRDNGRIGRTMSLGWAWQTPWLHMKQAHKKRCGLDSHVIFQNYGFITQRCQECWKIVVAPRTLTELFKLKEIEDDLGLPAKCGIEVREHTPRMYGGYFYTCSLEEGRDVYQIVRKAISEGISPDVSVILKRGCTEMEMEVGPSPFWVVTKENRELEEIIEERVEDTSISFCNPPDYMVAHIKQSWAHWAYAHGDETYLEYTDGQPLYPETVKYHEGDIEEIKADLAAARMNLLHGADTKTIATAQSIIKNNSTLGKKILGTALGYTELNPLCIGGHDETT